MNVLQNDALAQLAAAVLSGCACVALTHIHGLHEAERALSAMDAFAHRNRKSSDVAHRRLARLDTDW